MAGSSHLFGLPQHMLDNRSMHRSRESGRFQMDNHLSRAGDCGRSTKMELHSEDVGQEEIVLLLHGFTGFSGDWLPLLPQDFRYIIPSDAKGVMYLEK